MALAPETRQRWRTSESPGELLDLIAAGQRVGDCTVSVAELVAYCATTAHRREDKAWLESHLPQRGDEGNPFDMARRFGVADAWRGTHACALRDIVGDPWRPVVRLHRLFGAGEPAREPDVVDTCFITPLVRNLAVAAHDDYGEPHSFLDPYRLAVLADALEETGCDNPVVGGHLREVCGVCGGAGTHAGWPCYRCGARGKTPHVRGCWAVRLLMAGDAPGPPRR